jgi:type IV secretion system protein VirB1
VSLTIAAALALAVQCAPGVDPVTLVGIAKHESGLDPTRINVNSNGSRDLGLMQINESNFEWLGLTATTAMDPCRSLAAGALVLKSLSAYNSGSPTKGMHYAELVTASIHQVKATAPAPEIREPVAAPAVRVAPTPVFIGPARGRSLVYAIKSELPK